MSRDNSVNKKLLDNNSIKILDHSREGVSELPVLKTGLLDPDDIDVGFGKLPVGGDDYIDYTKPMNIDQPVQTTLEKRLNNVRSKYERNRRMELQLGLTPDAGSMPITPVNELTDMEEHVIDRREEIGFRRRTFWKSCCGQIIDRRATQFFVQVFIGVGIMVFCMVKICLAVPLEGCTGEDTTVYFSLLSALVGFYIPSPSMHKQ
jgi:hypothetical protein